ncbi:unnamed protein product [Orchesella dallaii]|uniref:Uncharacterized protein n=1 Tax=Orchesella dallaii TaxID=48710 RepID=A0ABP1QEN5_9HEXA
MLTITRSSLKVTCVKNKSKDKAHRLISLLSYTFIAFPILGGLLPIVAEDDVTTHIFKSIFPPLKNPILRRVLAGICQGFVVAIGAIICLQVLIIYIVFVIEPEKLLRSAITPPKSNSRNGFRSKIIIYRQLTILRYLKYDTFILYGPGLLFVGVNLVIFSVFFTIRRVFPLPLAMPIAVIGLVTACIFNVLVYFSTKMDSDSENFHRNWKRCNLSRAERKILNSCWQTLAFPIGIFTFYKKHTLPFIWNIIIDQVSNLLINL